MHFMKSGNYIMIHSPGAPSHKFIMESQRIIFSGNMTLRMLKSGAGIMVCASKVSLYEAYGIWYNICVFE